MEDRQYCIFNGVGLRRYSTKNNPSRTAWKNILQKKVETISASEGQNCERLK